MSVCFILKGRRAGHRGAYNLVVSHRFRRPEAAAAAIMIRSVLDETVSLILWSRK